MILVDLFKKQIIMLRSLILKVPSITSLATTAEVTAVETKIHNYNDLVKKKKKKNRDLKISDSESKNFTTSGYS